jgi:hypothetical protein
MIPQAGQHVSDAKRRPNVQGVEKGPDARRRPKVAGEAYPWYVEPAAEGDNEADGPLSAAC